MIVFKDVSFLAKLLLLLCTSLQLDDRSILLPKVILVHCKVLYYAVVVHSDQLSICFKYRYIHIRQFTVCSVYTIGLHTTPPADQLIKILSTRERNNLLTIRPNARNGSLAYEVLRHAPKTLELVRFRPDFFCTS